MGELGPAFILGNSPSLPVGLLPYLERCFTVGINRIALSGFTPTCTVVLDTPLVKRLGADIRKAGLLVTAEHIDHEQQDISLALAPGDAAWLQTPKPWRICCNGNSGVAAARWADSLGFGPVYLLGMSAAYSGVLTDFWGVNVYHQDGTLAMLSSELDMLLRSPTFVPADDEDLDALAGSQTHNQSELRDWLRRAVCK